MLNRIAPLAALLVALGTAPAVTHSALAQSAEAQSAADDTAVRTMAQNRKAIIGRPAAPERPVAPQAAAVAAPQGVTAPSPPLQRLEVAVATGRPPAR